MNELQLFSVMRKIIMEVTGVDECILGDVSEIAPRGEYAAVRVMSTVQATSKGKVTTVTNAEARTVTTTIKVPVMYSVTVNFYRGSAMERAIKLINCSRLAERSHAPADRRAWLGRLRSCPKPHGHAVRHERKSSRHRHPPDGLL